MPACRFVQMAQADDVGREDRFPGAVDRNPAHVDHRVNAFEQGLHGRAICQVALHDFFAVLCAGDRGQVGQAQHLRQGLEWRAQTAAEATGGAGE